MQFYAHFHAILTQKPVFLMLKMEEKPFVGTAEMEIDIDRLNTITERFSKIGSTPTLEPTDVVATVDKTMKYLQHRFSSKFEFDIQLPVREIVIPLNAALFSWVLENLTKNAIDVDCVVGAVEGVVADIGGTAGDLHQSAFARPSPVRAEIDRRGRGLFPDEEIQLHLPLGWRPAERVVRAVDLRRFSRRERSQDHAVPFPDRD